MEHRSHIRYDASLPKLAKRQRISKKARNILEKAFAVNPYHRQKDIEKLAVLSGEKPSRIKTWFLNRRAKEKQVKKQGNKTSQKPRKPAVLDTMLAANNNNSLVVNIEKLDGGLTPNYLHNCSIFNPYIHDEGNFEHYRIRVEEKGAYLENPTLCFNTVVQQCMLGYDPQEIRAEMDNIDDAVIQDLEYHEMLAMGQLYTSDDDNGDGDE